MTTAFFIRALISGFLVAAIALIARKSPSLGGLIASIPLVSTLGMIWLWRDTGNPKLVADYVYSAFWYFLPSMPMFLLIPWMLRSDIGFWTALGAGIALTLVLYLMTIGIAARFGVRL
ncbi:MAG: DUF3147 family protein [Sphingorhabdus sp.]